MYNTFYFHFCQTVWKFWVTRLRPLLYPRKFLSKPSETLQDLSNKLFSISEKFSDQEYLEVNQLMLNVMQEQVSTENEWKQKYEALETCLQKEKIEHLTRLKKYVKRIVQADGTLLQSLPVPWRKDKDVVTLAILQNGLALQFASEDLRDCNSVVRKAIKQNPLALYHASERLQKQFAEDENDAQIWSSGLEQRIRNKDQFPKELYPYLSPTIQSDPVVTQRVLSEDGNLLRFVPKRLRYHSKIIKTAVAQNGLSLRYAAKQNKSILHTAVSQNGLALQYALKGWKNNASVVRKAMLQNRDAFQYASKEIQEDPQWQMLATDQDFRTPSGLS